MFDGEDIGTLWDDLTDDQKHQIKKSVFTSTLTLNDYDPTKYDYNYFQFTDEEVKANELKMKEDIAPQEKVLAECTRRSNRNRGRNYDYNNCNNNRNCDNRCRNDYNNNCHQHDRCDNRRNCNYNDRNNHRNCY